MAQQQTPRSSTRRLFGSVGGSSGLVDSNALVKGKNLSGAHQVSSFLGEKFIAKGYLLKLSQKNKWQKRFFIIKGPYLMYWANKGKSEKRRRTGEPVTEDCTIPDAAIDLRCMAKCELENQRSVLCLTSNSGRQTRLRPTSAPDKRHMPSWLHACTAVMQSAEAPPLSTPSSEGTDGKAKRVSMLVFNEGLDTPSEDTQSIGDSENGDEFEIASDLKPGTLASEEAASDVPEPEEAATEEEVTIKFQANPQGAPGPPSVAEPVQQHAPFRPSSDMQARSAISPPPPPHGKRPSKKTATCSLFGSCM